MSTLTITINTGDSDAMVTAMDVEVAAVLRTLADRIEGGGYAPGDQRPMVDVNGARVGEFVWTDA